MVVVEQGVDVMGDHGRGNLVADGAEVAGCRVLRLRCGIYRGGSGRISASENKTATTGNHGCKQDELCGPDAGSPGVLFSVHRDVLSRILTCRAVLRLCLSRRGETKVRESVFVQPRSAATSSVCAAGSPSSGTPRQHLRGLFGREHVYGPGCDAGLTDPAIRFAAFRQRLISLDYLIQLLLTRRDLSKGKSQLLRSEFVIANIFLQEAIVNPVEYHLRLVLYYWCGARTGQYTIDSELRQIWSGHVPVPGYEPDGIHKLMQTMYSDPLFAPCPSAHGILPGEFFKGGDIQTVRALYTRLLPCGANAPVDITAAGGFQ
jgi:hypothetical protein